ncbi:hypothetical protein L0222_18250 [bacterium]|nr:hypothetical protein [bacterium]MCI0603610.1 hypothetical protein [bacterium]
MDKRFFISGIVIGIASLLLGFVIHANLLVGDYAQLTGLFRGPEDAQKHFPFMLIAHFVLGFGFTWIYRKGVEAGKPAIGQGVRFGLAVAVLMTIPMYLIYYAVQPMPGMVVAKQIGFDVIGVILLGILAALLNPPSQS